MYLFMLAAAVANSPQQVTTDNGYKALPTLVQAYSGASRPEKLKLLKLLGTSGEKWETELRSELFSKKNLSWRSVEAEAWSKVLVDLLLAEALSNDFLLAESALRSLCLLEWDVPVPFSDRCATGGAGLLHNQAGKALRMVSRERWAVLSNLLEDADSKVFYWSASTLLDLNTHAASQAVLARLTHPLPEMRAAAAWLVGFNRISAGVPGVETLLDDADQKVRDVAVEAFREHLYEWKVHEPMIARFSSLSLRQKLSVLKLERGEMFDNSKLGPAAFADADETVKAGGMRILWTRGKHFGIEFLSQGLNSTSPAMRLQSARMILSDFKPQANDLVRPLLSDPDPEVRQAITLWLDM